MTAAQAVGHLRRGGAMRSEARRDKREGKRRGRLNRLVHWAFTLVTQIELTVSYLTRRQPRASSSDRRRGAPARRDQRQPAPRPPPTVVPADESSKCVSSQRRIFPSGAGRRVEPSLQQQRRRPWVESFLSRLDSPCGALNLLPSGYASAACTAATGFVGEDYASERAAEKQVPKARRVAPPRCFRERGRDGRPGCSAWHHCATVRRTPLVRGLHLRTSGLKNPLSDAHSSAMPAASSAAASSETSSPASVLRGTTPRELQLQGRRCGHALREGRGGAVGDEARDLGEGRGTGGEVGVA